MCSWMVMDQEVRGQFVMHSFIETNTDWHLEHVIEDFKRAHAAWALVMVVMVDKDLREINVVRNDMSQARPLLCEECVHVTRLGDYSCKQWKMRG